MNYHYQPKHRQIGNASTVVIIALVAALVFALGIVFYQNFILESSSKDQKPEAATPAPTVKTKTFRDAASGVSFSYPATWQAETMDMGGPLMVTVSNQAGKKVAYLETKLGSLGGAGTFKYNFLKADRLSEAIDAKNCAVIKQSVDQPFELFYGVASTTFCASTGERNAGPTYLTFDTGNAKQGTISFSNIDYMGSGSGQNFSSLDAAKSYLQSDEYHQLSAMFASLKLQ